MDPTAAASRTKSTPFGRPAATLQRDGPASVTAVAPINNLVADKQIKEHTAYERQISFRIKSETKDGQLVLHQVCLAVYNRMRNT